MTIDTANRRTSTYHLAAEHVIDRSADAVWAVVADYRMDHGWRKGVRSMEPTPAGLVQPGTVTDEVMRLAGSSYRNLGLVTEVGPGRSFTWQTTSGADASGSRTVTPLSNERCTVGLSMSVNVAGGQRLIGPLLAKLLQRNLNGDLRRLRALVERSS